MAEYVDRGLKRIGITISKPMLAIICIVSGIIVVVFPSLLVWIVGLFLVIQGALLLTDLLEQKRPTNSVTSLNGFHCSQCGTSNTEEAVYCKECGKKFEQA